MDGYCVYCHTFPNGKRYIGITKTDPNKRWQNGAGYSTQPKMARAIAKYGWENVTHEVLATGLDHEKANEMEQYYIAKYDTFNNGYNATIGGDAILTTHLDTYVLDMIRNGKAKLANYSGSIAETVYNDRYTASRANVWNMVAQDVVQRHRHYSPTAERDIAEFWWYFCEIVEYAAYIAAGGDPSKWEEQPYNALLCTQTAYGGVVHDTSFS